MDFSTASFDLIKHDLNNARTINSDQVLYNRIKESGDSKAQLQKAAEEFEAIFITKMLLSNNHCKRAIASTKIFTIKY